MLLVKIGLQLSSLRLPFRQALQAAAELGAAGVELDARGELKPQELSRSATRQIRKLVDDFNLRVAAVSFRTRRGYGVSADLDARIEGTRAAMQWAYELGAPYVINAVGRVPAESQGPEWELLVQSLTELGAIGHRTGAILAADTGSESGTDLARLVAALPHGALGVNFNAGNLIANGQSPRESLDALASHIVHVHATDAVRDISRGRALDVPLGGGSADYPHLLARLENYQYRGYLTVTTEQTNQPRFALAQAIEYLRRL